MSPEPRRLALTTWEADEYPGGEAGSDIKATLSAHYQHLRTVIPEAADVSNLGRHIHFNMRHDHWDIVIHDLPSIEKAMLKLVSEIAEKPIVLGFEQLLHTRIKTKALPLYRGEHYREAVLAGYLVVTSILREQTGSKLDGVDLANHSLGKEPKLLIAEGDDQTSRNLRTGYADLVRGGYAAVRNVYTHQGEDFQPTSRMAAQHLVFTSILVRRLLMAKVTNKEKTAS